MAVSDKHAVLGNTMVSPFPDGLQTAMLGTELQTTVCLFCDLPWFVCYYPIAT